MSSPPPQSIKVGTPTDLKPSHSLSGIQDHTGAIPPDLPLKTDFLWKVKPRYWTAEGFLSHGYLDLDLLLHDLATMSVARARGPTRQLMISHCRNLVKFYRSEEGGVLIQLLKSRQRLVKEHHLFDMNASIAALKNYRDVPPTTTRSGSSNSSFSTPVLDGDRENNEVERVTLVAAEETNVINVAQPWNKLMAAYLEKQRGLSIDDMDLSPETDLDAEQAHLYQHCLRILAKDTPTLLEQKQLLTMLSGIMDLRLVTFARAREQLLDTRYTEPLHKEISDTLKLLEPYIKLGPTILRLRIESLLGKKADQVLAGEDMSPAVPALRLINKMVTCIDAATLPTTEAEYVALWKDTLETLSEGKLKLRSGETICSATAVQKRSSISLWNIANDTESGRKVDLILQVDGLEVMNIEAKRGQDLIQAESQYSKNLRINQAIYLAARQRGVVLETIPFLDIRGCTGLVCVLTKKQDNSVFMGGLACQQVIELPVRLDDIVDFMSKGGGLQTLTCFVDIVLKFQESVKQQLKIQRAIGAATSTIQSNSSNNSNNSNTNTIQHDNNNSNYAYGENEKDNDSSCTPPPRPPLNLGAFTLLTPKKSRRGGASLNQTIFSSSSSGGSQQKRQRGASYKPLACTADDSKEHRIVYESDEDIHGASITVNDKKNRSNAHNSPSNSGKNTKGSGKGGANEGNSKRQSKGTGA